MISFTNTLPHLGRTVNHNICNGTWATLGRGEGFVVVSSLLLLVTFKHTTVKATGQLP